MVTITNGTIDWELSCERYALIGGSPPSGWTVKANTCANYARQLNAPFASFGVGGGDGTVRSVALAADEDVFEVSGSPVTDIGTLILALKEQGAGLVFSGPITGADAVPTFRVLEPTDVNFGSASYGAVWYFDGVDWTWISSANGDVSGPYHNLQIKADAVGTLEIINAAVTMPKIAQSGATTGQAIIWNGTAWIPTTITGYTDEQAQDAVGGILVDSAEIDFTYNDGTPSISAVLIVTGVTPGTYTKLTVDSKGRVTSATTLSASDIPSLPASIITSGVLPVVRGGTGLSALGTALQYLRTNAGATAMEWATLTAITGTLTAPRIPYASGAGTLTDTADLQWDNTTKGMRAGAGAGAVVGTYTAYPSTGNAFYGFASVSGAVYGTLENFWDSSGAGSAYWIIKVGGASAGDPFIMFVIASATTWSAGVDNSDNDIFKIGPYQNPGNGVLGLHILPTGEAAWGGAPSTALSLRIATAKPLGVPAGTDATRATGNANPNLQWNTTSGRLEAISPTGPYYKSIISYTQPALAIGLAAGTGAAVIVKSESSNEVAGSIQLTTGTGTSSGTVFVVTVSGNMGNRAFVQLTAGNSNTAAQMTNLYISATTSTTFTVSVVSALAASSVFVLYYRVDG